MTVNLPTDAISVRQPWAWAIIHAGKNIENRGAVALRHMRLNRGSRTTLAVHAAQGMTQDEYSSARDFMAGIGVTCPPPGDLVRGAIIGAVRVDGVVTASPSPWFFGPRGIVLHDPIAVDPIYCAGALGLFNWHDARKIAPPPLAGWMRARENCSSKSPRANTPTLFDLAPQIGGEGRKNGGL